jgi:hypothetical protein
LDKEVKIGQQVHFVNAEGKERPAIIVNVFSQESGCANLLVFADGSNDKAMTVYDGKGDCYCMPVWATSVSKADPCPATSTYPTRTWHWPETEE